MDRQMNGHSETYIPLKLQMSFRRKKTGGAQWHHMHVASVSLNYTVAILKAIQRN